MKYEAIMFDLDGTLLPMDLEVFTRTYLGLLCRRFPEYDPKALVDGIWAGTGAMVKNDGTMTNGDRFWAVFAGLMGREVLERIGEFDQFYHTDFHQAKAICGPNPLAKAAVEAARKGGRKVVLATNPIFPACAVEARLSWIGLKMEDFDYVTSYENSGFCKPNPAYYLAICQKIGVKPEHCLMVGNDRREDGVGGREAGMDVYIARDCLIEHGVGDGVFPEGTFAEMVEVLRA